jgi:DNA-binding IclR family transcriptional regulator
MKSKSITEITNQASGVVSMRRGLELIEIISQGESGWSLSELARTMDVNKVIVLRLLNELVAAGYIYCRSDNGLYELTFKLSNLGLRKLSQSRLLDQSSEVLKELASASGELVRLAVVEGVDKITWVLVQAGSKRSLQIDPNYRLEIGLTTHAVGKAWLSTLYPEIAWSLIHQQGIQKCTVHSKSTKKEIEADWKWVQKKGFAISYEENELGVGAIAAPLFITDTRMIKRCVAVVSVGAPVYRTSKKELVAMAPLLMEKTQALAKIWPIRGVE